MRNVNFKRASENTDENKLPKECESRLTHYLFLRLTQDLLYIQGLIYNVQVSLVFKHSYIFCAKLML